MKLSHKSLDRTVGAVDGSDCLVQGLAVAKHLDPRMWDEFFGVGIIVQDHLLIKFVCLYGGSKVFLEDEVVAGTYSSTRVLLCRWKIGIWQSELWSLISS